MHKGGRAFLVSVSTSMTLVSRKGRLRWRCSLTQCHFLCWNDQQTLCCWHKPEWLPKWRTWEKFPSAHPRGAGCPGHAGLVGAATIMGCLKYGAWLSPSKKDDDSTPRVRRLHLIVVDLNRRRSLATKEGRQLSQNKGG